MGFIFNSLHLNNREAAFINKTIFSSMNVAFDDQEDSILYYVYNF